MVAVKIYDVHVTREGDAWLADVPELPGAHTYARSLTGLRRSVREVIVLMGDYSDDDVRNTEAFETNFRYVGLPQPVADEVAEARELRSQLVAVEEKARRATARAARDMHDQGLSLRDSAEILGVSFQRVQQLVSS